MIGNGGLLKMKAKPFNEGKSCDALIRYLETENGVARSNLRSPERDRHKNPVELIWGLGEQLYALEHTGIEPFKGFIEQGADWARHFDPIKAALRGIHPDEVVHLHVPAKAMQDLKKWEIRRAQMTIIEWAKRILPTLPLRGYGNTRLPHTESPANLPFPVSMFRFESRAEAAGSVEIVNFVEGLELAREDRLRTTCEKKFPKLHAWKSEEQARTILLLEDNDIQLTNHVVVAETFKRLAMERRDRPDETYLITTCTGTWYVWPLLIDDISLLDPKYCEQRAWEADPASLQNLTGR